MISKSAEEGKWSDFSTDNLTQSSTKGKKKYPTAFYKGLSANHNIDCSLKIVGICLVLSPRGSLERIFSFIKCRSDLQRRKEGGNSSFTQAKYTPPS